MQVVQVRTSKRVGLGVKEQPSQTEERFERARTVEG